MNSFFLYPIEHLFFSAMPAVIALGIKWVKSQIFGDVPCGTMVEATCQHRPDSVIAGLAWHSYIIFCTGSRSLGHSLGGSLPCTAMRVLVKAFSSLALWGPEVTSVSLEKVFQALTHECFVGILK